MTLAAAAAAMAAAAMASEVMAMAKAAGRGPCTRSRRPAGTGQCTRTRRAATSDTERREKRRDIEHAHAAAAVTAAVADDDTDAATKDDSQKLAANDQTAHPDPGAFLPRPRRRPVRLPVHRAKALLSQTSPGFGLEMTLAFSLERRRPCHSLQVVLFANRDGVRANGAGWTRTVSM